jgi:hypothetical protein
MQRRRSLGRRSSIVGSAIVLAYMPACVAALATQFIFAAVCQRAGVGAAGDKWVSRFGYAGVVLAVSVGVVAAALQTWAVFALVS